MTEDGDWEPGDRGRRAYGFQTARVLEIRQVTEPTGETRNILWVKWDQVSFTGPMHPHVLLPLDTTPDEDPERIWLYRAGVMEYYATSRGVRAYPVFESEELDI